MIVSLSVLLVPLAIGVASVTVSSLPNEDAILEKDKTYYEIKTRIKDEQLLQETLNNYGSQTKVQNEEVISSIGDTDITFIKGTKDIYHAYFHKDIPLEDAEQFIDTIYNEYTRIVQRKTYDKLLARAESQGLKLEYEETNEEEAIVLTFEVKE